MVVKNVSDNSVATSKVIDDGDVSCWNCFTVESAKEEKERKPAVTLKALRKQEREKLKLYSFIANELSRPKAVPLKQKMSTNFAVAQELDREITAKLNTQQSIDVQKLESPLNIENGMSESLNAKQYIKKDNYEKIYKVPYSNNETSTHLNRSKNELQKSDKILNLPPKITHKIEIDTASLQATLSDTERLTTLQENTAMGDKNTFIVNENIRPRKKRTTTSSSDELDRIEKISSSGSDSGYMASSLPHGINDSLKSEDPVPVARKTNSLGRNTLPLDHEIPRVKSNQVIVFNRYMPSLNTSHETDISSSSKSLCVGSSQSPKKTPKTLRWSTLSFHQKPLFQDEVYMSDDLSPGHATLPRRSNSPLPHDREMDRDRFPHNRSLLQTRSESMASVYSGAGEGTRGTVTVKGEVQFSLLYNYRMGALEVGVRRCRDLAAVDLKRNRSDPYVKVYLLPDKSKAGKRKTKVKKNTLSPVFEETLSFAQPLATLSSRTLWLSVWHADMFGRNDFLGEVTLPLADVVFDDPAPTWYKLQERTEQFDENQGTRGDLIIGLKFVPDDNSKHKGTLHVLVKEAKNLVATKPNGQADVFCKSYLLPERGRLAKQKTNVSRRTLSPKWEHTFTYKGVTLQELSARALELSVWDRDRLASNDFMGAVRLSLGSGTYMGTPVNWMDSVGKETTLWQTMMQRPNLWVEGSLPLRPQLSS